MPSQERLRLYDYIISLQNQNIQPLESLGTGSPLYGDTTVISECLPYGTATKMKHHLEEKTNVSFLLCPVWFGHGHIDKFYKGSIIAVVEIQISFWKTNVNWKTK